MRFAGADGIEEQWVPEGVDGSTVAQDLDVAADPDGVHAGGQLVGEEAVGCRGGEGMEPWTEEVWVGDP